MRRKWIKEAFTPYIWDSCWIIFHDNKRHWGRSRIVSRVFHLTILRHLNHSPSSIWNFHVLAFSLFPAVPPMLLGVSFYFPPIPSIGS
ncbi:hypothetical protein BGZ63DRAFT_376306 [Mariannaea sp. PMI_226]|nr:hypothetical protein BGZ63DRAFT_376306 [Mariannaea sp. PMI_226]